MPHALTALQEALVRDCARQGYVTTAIPADDGYVLVASKGRVTHRLVKELSRTVFREKVEAVERVWAEARKEKKNAS